MPDTNLGAGSSVGGQPAGPRLESWKEIASYLGRDVTTVRRWERKEGLPVHRLHHSKIGSVYAFPSELEVWRHGRSRSRDAIDAPPPGSGAGEDIGNVSSASTRVASAPMETFSSRTAEEGHGDKERPVAIVDARAASRRFLSPSVVLMVALATFAAGAVWLLARRAPAPAPAAVPTIAVLPLRNLSGDPSQQFFADGMTEAVIARLAGISGARVTSPASVMQFRDADKPVPEIAAALNADVILEGSVVRSGNRVRLIAQLIDVRTNTHLWATEYEREVGDVLALQGELAEAIAARVQTTVQPPKRSRTTIDRPVSPEAYEQYLKGRYLLNASTKTSVRQSVGAFESAIAIDASFAQAHAALAAAQLDLNTGLVGVAPADETTELAISEANLALTIDPDLAEAYSVLGRARTNRFQWAEAEASYCRALELNPSDARTYIWYAEWMVGQGRLADAVDEARRGRDLDPLSLRVGAEYGLILYIARRYDDAARQLRAVLAIQPNHSQALWWLGMTQIAQGNTAEAVGCLEKAVTSSGRSPGIVASLARAYGAAGRREDARRLVEELVARSQREYVPPTSMMSAYIGLGDREKAIEWLQQAVALGSDGGIHLQSANPANDALRSDPRFEAAFKRIGLQ